MRRATARGPRSGTPSRLSSLERVSPSTSPSRYRWVVLGAGSLATAALAAVQGGLPALGPAIQETFGLSLVEVTAVFTAFALGTVATLLAWGVLSDRVGERFVIAGGLMAGALAMVGAAASDGYVALLASMTLSGMLGASAIAASGRAVFGWFPRDERGLVADDHWPDRHHVAAGALPVRRARLVSARRCGRPGRGAGGGGGRARLGGPVVGCARRADRAVPAARSAGGGAAARGPGGPA